MKEIKEIRRGFVSIFFFRLRFFFRFKVGELLMPVSFSLLFLSPLSLPRKRGRAKWIPQVLSPPLCYAHRPHRFFRRFAFLAHIIFKVHSPRVQSGKSGKSKFELRR